MFLHDELQSIGCIADESAFEDGLADIFSRNNRDRTTDAMLCDWPAARVYCRDVCGYFGIADDGVADEMILRRLTNLRKNHGSKLPSRPSAFKPSLEKSLTTVGIVADVEEFREIIRSVYMKLHRLLSVDSFLFRWRDAAHFCGVVSSVMKFDRSIATDAIVLRTLLNMRRRGQLNVRERANGS